MRDLPSCGYCAAELTQDFEEADTGVGIEKHLVGWRCPNGCPFGFSACSGCGGAAGRRYGASAVVPVETDVKKINALNTRRLRLVKTSMTSAALIQDPAEALRFILAGNAHVTFVSRKTGARFTYKVRQADPRPGDTREPPHFVSVLTSPDVYSYLGVIFGRMVYSRGAKSKIGADASSARAFAWAWKHLSAGRMPSECEVWHEGRCARCGRQLTVPESIVTGLGPECASKLGIARAS